MSRIEESLYRKFGLNESLNTPKKIHKRRKLTEANINDVQEQVLAVIDECIVNTLSANEISSRVEGYNTEWCSVNPKADLFDEVAIGAIFKALFGKYKSANESRQTRSRKRKLNEWANPDDTFFWDIKGMVNPKHVGDLVTGTEIENWFKQSQKDDDPLTRGYATLDDWWADTDTTKYFKYYDIYEED